MVAFGGGVDQFRFLTTVDGVADFMSTSRTNSEWVMRKGYIKRFNGTGFTNFWETVLFRQLLTHPLGVRDYMLLATSQEDWNARKKTVQAANPERFRYVWFIAAVATGLTVRAQTQWKVPAAA